MNAKGAREKGMVVVVGVILCAALFVASLMGQSHSSTARSKTKKGK